MLNPSRGFALLVAATALVLGTLSSARAQNEPTRPGVARVSLLVGDLAIQRGDSQDHVEATVNAPLLAQDSLSTGGAGSQAEIQLTGSSILDLDQNTQIRFVDLDPGQREIQAAQGTIELSMLRGSGDSPQIDTPSLSMRPNSGGRYRVTVTADGQTEITVRSGSAQIITPQGSRMLAPGVTLIAQGSSSNPSVQDAYALPPDDFDTFVSNRDVVLERPFSYSYVDTSIDGVADLYAYGRWVYQPPHGHIWIPYSQPPGWAPYNNGRWVWEGDYGWTWIGYEPWGWAPYHYGRWAYTPGYGWGWHPPAPQAPSSAAVFVEPPAWQPALVGFIGFGAGGFSASFGYGTIGWVPLAPSEPYYPWYHNPGYGGYGNSTYVVNNVNTTVIYQNARAPGAVSALTTRRFQQGAFVRPTVVTQGMLQRATALRGTVPVIPTQANLRFSSAPLAHVQAPQARFAASNAFAGRRPAQPRIPFATQQRVAAAAVHAKPIVTTLKQWRTAAAPIARPQNDARPYAAATHAPPRPAAPEPPMNAGTNTRHTNVTHVNPPVRRNPQPYAAATHAPPHAAAPKPSMNAGTTTRHTPQRPIPTRTAHPKKAPPHKEKTDK